MNFTKDRVRVTIMVLLVAAALIFTGCQGGNTKKQDSAVAVVNGKAISQEVYNKNLLIFKKNYEGLYGDKVWSVDVGGRTFLQAVQENVLEKLITDEVIIQHLQKNNVEIDGNEVDKQYQSYTDKIKDQPETVKFLEDNAIHEEFIKDQIRTELYVNAFKQQVVQELDLTDERLKAYYNENLEEYRDIQVKASHILVEKEEEAKELLAKIKAGADFAELATEHSKDPGSAAQGGDLGYFPKGMMVPEFEKAAFSLEPGQVSDIVPTTYGFHIIKVVDRIDEMKKFEDVKEEIRSKLTEEGITNKLEAVKKEQKIEKYPENIK